MELVAETRPHYRIEAQPLSPAKTAQAVTFGAYRRALLARARDITPSIADRPALVIAPHPDDETLGCGATIARKTAAGSPVHIAIITDGRGSHRSSIISPDALARIRCAEAIEAAARLGVDPEHITFLQIPDGESAQNRELIQSRIVELVQRLRPADVFIPHRIDRNADHRALGALFESLAREGRLAPRVLAYPVWFWTLRAWCVDPSDIFSALRRLAGAMLSVRPVVVRTSGHLGAKRHALAAHRSQTTRLTDEPTWATLDESFLSHFFRRAELFFEIRTPPLRAAAPSATRPVRILHMLPDLQVGGGQQLLLRNISALDGRFAHHVCAIKPGSGMEDHFAAAGVRLVRLEMCRPWQLPRCILDLIRAARHHGIDIIHTNNTGIDKLCGQIAGLICRLPVINTVHSEYEPPTTGDGLKGRILRTLAPVRSTLERILGRATFTHAIAVSHRARESWRPLLSQSGITDSGFTVVHPGIDPTPFERPLPESERRRLAADLNLTDAGPVLICIGRLVPGKGQGILLSALPRILEQHPRAVLLLVGDGPYRAELEQMAQSSGCAGAVRFLGTRTDIPALLQLADLAIFPTFREGFGLVLLEAMAAAKPILASRLEVFNEIVEEGKTADYFTPGDPEDLARAANQMLTNRDRLTRMGEQGRRTIHARFSIHQTAQALESIYDTALAAS
jgi:glycosyltransferase involved in cell wall biosynthesis/LmbE family N-acetylglucosaminyl deacetylase